MSLIQRSIRIAASIAVCVAVFAAVAQAETADELLTQAVELHNSGKVQAAQAKLDGLDPAALSSDAQRATLRELVAAIGKAKASNQTLADAQAAEKAGDYDKAMQLYKQVTGDNAASRAQRQAALVGLARSERALMDAGKAVEPTPIDNPPATVVVQPDPEPVAIENELNGGAAPDGRADEVGPVQNATVVGSDDSSDGVVEVVVDKPARSDADRQIRQAKTLYAQKLVTEGDDLFTQRRYDEAKAKYAEALGLDPDNAAAKAGLERKAVAGPAGGGVLDQEIAKRKLERQRAIARYEQAMAEAQAKREAGSFNQAISAAVLAKAIVDTKRQWLHEDEYQAKRDAALDLEAAIKTEKEADRIATLQADQAEEAARNEAERVKLEEQKSAKIKELLTRARDLSREQQYELALEQLEQVLFLDPNNGAAQFMSELIKDQILNERMKRVLNDRRRQHQEQRIENMEEMVPINDLITYPADWPELTERRLSDLGRGGGSEVDRVAKEKLQQPIPIDFQANQFANVIEYLRNVTGANFFVQWNAMEAAGITRDTPVTMQLQSVAAEKALTLILDEVGGNLVPLGYTIDDGIVVVATREFLASKREIRTYDIRDLILTIPSFDQAPEFNLEDVAADAGGGGGGGSIFEDISEDDTASLSRADRILQVQDLIRNSVDPDNWRSVGARPEIASSMEELNGTLIVNTTSENHASIGALLGQLREQRALQISVDTRFLSVTDNFLEEVGLDVDMQFHRDKGEPDIVVDQNSAANTAVLATSTAFPAAATGLTLGTGVIGTVGGGLSFFLDDLEVSILLTATQLDQRNTLINTPRLTFFNGQRAYVTISQQTAFVSDLEPVVANNAIAFDPEVDVISDGVVLDLEGTISADRRYVTLTARPSLARVRALTPFQVFGAGGVQGLDNDGDATVDEDPIDGVDNDGDAAIDEDPPEPIAAGTIQQPVVDLTTLRTTVSVPDKGTLLLGGQRLITEVEIESGVPVLSKIPIINRLFTNRSITRDETTLLILIKPTIIMQSEQEERLFPGLNQAPALYNLGVEP